MKAYDALVTIRFSGVDGYEVETAFADGSTILRKAVRVGAKFNTNNVLGEYYVLRNDGRLAIYDVEGLVRIALPAGGDREPGKCR